MLSKEGLVKNYGKSSSGERNFGLTGTASRVEESCKESSCMWIIVVNPYMGQEEEITTHALENGVALGDLVQITVMKEVEGIRL